MSPEVDQELRKMAEDVERLDERLASLEEKA